MKISGDCPNCKEKVSIDIDKLEMKAPKELQNPSTETQQVLIEKPVEKEPEIKIETVIENFKPGFECPDDNCEVGVHKNKNYSKRVKGKCTNCDQFTKLDKGKCPWCKKTDTIESIEQEELEDLGIEMPPEVEHTHE